MVDKAIPKKPKESSVTDKLENYFRDNIEKNGAPKDKNAFDDLRKSSWSDSKVNLNENSRSMTKRVLSKILKEKGFDVPEGIGDKARSSSSEGGVIAEFAKTVEKTVTGETPQTQPNTQSKGYGIFGNTQSQSQSSQTTTSTQTTETKTEKKPVSLDDQKKMMRAMFDFPKQMFYQFDLVEGEKNPPKEIPKNFSEKVDLFADNVAVYCYENEIHLPTWIEGFALVLAGLVLFGSPIAMKIISAKKEKKKEKSNKLDGHSLAEKIAEQERQKVTEA